MIKLKAKLIKDDALKVNYLKTKKTSMVEVLALICFLIDEIVNNVDVSRNQVIELVKNLIGEGE